MESDDLEQEIIELVKKETNTQYEVTVNTNIRDLGVWGDDAWDLLVKFVKKYNVDGQTLLFSAHFESEGYTLVDMYKDIVSIITMKKYPNNLKPLSVADLVNAARIGKFDIYTVDEIKRYKK